MTIRAITFDFWSTLYRSTRPSRLRRLLHIQSALSAVGHDDIAEASVADAMQQAWIVWDRVWREEQRTFEASRWLSLVLGELDLALPKSLFTTTVHAVQTASLDPAVIPADGTTDMLARLVPRFRLGVISDTGVTPGWVLRSLMKRDGLLHDFEYLIFSGEFGRSKPHPTVFLTMLDRLEVQPREAVHVGDLRRTDVAGARGVGMRSVRYAGIRDDRDDAYPEADAVIHSHDHLESVLEEWSHNA